MKQKKQKQKQNKNVKMNNLRHWESVILRALEQWQVPVVLRLSNNNILDEWKEAYRFSEWDLLSLDVKIQKEYC